MATWVVHLRIADYFINTIDCLNSCEFAAGSLAPDCGYGEKDSFGEFTPPPTVTHWSPSGKKCDCRYNDFFDTYLENIDFSDKSFSFYLGYYVHLMTDIMWSATMYLPTLTMYKKEYDENPEFLKVIKKDWRDLDYKYMYENPDMYAFKILEEKKNIDDYLPYYEKGQLTKQIHCIIDYYKQSINTDNIYREYSYLAENEVNNFVKSACALIEKKLMNKLPELYRETHIFERM